MERRRAALLLASTLGSTAAAGVGFGSAGRADPCLAVELSGTTAPMPCPHNPHACTTQEVDDKTVTACPGLP